MSIIVGVTKNGRTVLAADSLNVFGQERIPANNCRALKVRPVGDALLAITGWSLYDNIMVDLLSSREPPPLRDDKEIFAFFMEFWKELHERYPFVNDQPHEKDSPFGDFDASFMIANAAGIFKVSQDGSVCKFDQYYVIGSGGVYALGALHQIYNNDADAEQIARRACETAIEFDIYCGAPIDIFEVGRE